MISISGNEWKQKKINKNIVEKIKQDHNFSENLSKLVVSRNFNDNEIYTIDNNLDLNNIFIKNNDYLNALELVSEAIHKKEIIYILGDYDVDGSCSTSLLARYFKSINHPFFFLYT